MKKLIPSRRLRSLAGVVDDRELRAFMRRRNFTKPQYSLDLGFASAPWQGSNLWTRKIAVGDRAVVRVRPTKPFDVQSIRVPSTIAQDFELCELMIGGERFVYTPIPCAQFSEVSPSSAVLLPDIGPGVDLVMVVRNVGPEPARFIGTVRGYPLPRIRPRKLKPHTWQRKEMERWKHRQRSVRAKAKAAVSKAKGVVAEWQRALVALEVD